MRKIFNDKLNFLTRKKELLEWVYAFMAFGEEIKGDKKGMEDIGKMICKQVDQMFVANDKYHTMVQDLMQIDPKIKKDVDEIVEHFSILMKNGKLDEGLKLIRDLEIKWFEDSIKVLIRKIKEKLLLQETLENRVAIYKTLIRENFAKNQSVFIVLPNEYGI